MSENEKKLVHLSGFARSLPDGRKVFGASQDNSFYWNFTNETGGVTAIRLSREAMNAVIAIHQDICGASSQFAFVEFIEPGPDEQHEAGHADKA